MSHTNTEASLLDYFGAPISVYTRQQAIDDGVLVDVTEWANEAGFKLSAVVTRAVWEDCCNWTDEDDRNSHHAGQTTAGRAWDVLFLAGMAAREKRNQGRSQLHFYISRIPRPGTSDTNKIVTLKLHIGPGDDGEAVLTIMLPHEE